MTKHEQIRYHLRMIKRISGWDAIWGTNDLLSRIQMQLDALRELLGEPEKPNKEKIKNQYRLLGLAINWRGPDKHKQLKWVRRHLDTLKDMLLEPEPEPEPETLAASVLRLTDELNAAEKRVKSLQADLGVATRGNAFLRERLSLAERQVARDNECLRKRWDKIKVLETELDAVTRSNAELKMRIDRKEACLNRAMEELQRIKLSLELNPSKLLEENRKLNREYALQKKYVEILERETRNYTRRLTWWSKLQAKK